MRIVCIFTHGRATGSTTWWNDQNFFIQIIRSRIESHTWMDPLGRARPRAMQRSNPFSIWSGRRDWQGFSFLFYERQNGPNRGQKKRGEYRSKEAVCQFQFNYGVHSEIYADHGLNLSLFQLAFGYVDGAATQASVRFGGRIICLYSLKTAYPTTRPL